MHNFHTRLRSLVLLLAVITVAGCRFFGPGGVSVLLLGGSSGSHKPDRMSEILAQGLSGTGLSITYTEDIDLLSADQLARHDVIAIYKDDGELSAGQESALLGAVEKGMGMVAIHCASHAFRNSPYYGALVGGRFKGHGRGVFRPRIVDAQHPITDGLDSFETWDETYVHNELGKDLRVLMTRAESGAYEPSAWVRRHGEGRVFYTALGHDERTWRQEAFQELLHRAIRWAAGRTDEPEVELPDDYLAEEPPPPLSPQESIEKMHLPEGFRVELFAAEPDVSNPMTMTFDERGRLWIIESTDYPNKVEESVEGNDQIKICEDTDGDGVADKFTVFADGLNIPTSLLHGGGGLLVAQAPHILLLRDTDGDDRADDTKILYTGFGRFDTHAVLNNFRYGLDNWIWATVGYSGGEVTVAGTKHRILASVFRFRPDGSALEVLTPTQSNTWGLGFSETGQVFMSKANRMHHLHLGVANRFYESVQGWHGVGSESIEDHKHFHPVTTHIRQVDDHGGYTSAAGKSVYTARGFPQEFWDRTSFVCEPTGHLIHTDFLVRAGSAFVARDGWNLMASRDPWTAPVEALVGPDSSVWFLDWYNYIVRHNPTPAGFETGVGNAYVTDQRDKKHGRIYRIVYEASEPSPIPPVGELRPVQWLGMLRHENMRWRLTAQRLLVERGHSDIVPQLRRLVDNRSLDERENNPGVLHALWTLHGLGALDSPDAELSKTVVAALEHPAAGVRRAALAVLPRTSQSVRSILAAGSLRDGDASVRLEAMLSLAEMPASVQVARAIGDLVSEPRNAVDRWIPDAATSLAARNARFFLRSVVSSPPAVADSPALSELIARVSEHHARTGNSMELSDLFSRLGTAKATIAESVLQGLAEGWPRGQRLRLSGGAQTQLLALSQKLTLSGRVSLAALIYRFGEGDRSDVLREQARKVRHVLRTQVANRNLDDARRIQAAESLLRIGDHSDSIEVLLDQLHPRSSAKLINGLLAVLEEGKSIGANLISRWRDLPSSSHPRATRLLLKRPRSTELFMQALEKGTIPSDTVILDHQQQLIQHSDPAVAKRAAEVFDWRPVAEEERARIVEAKLSIADGKGDPRRGQQVFEKNCVQCHRFRGSGGEIGPDLSGTGARPRSDILVDILDPNRSVEGNFRQWIVTTKDGLNHTGLMGAMNETSFSLIDTLGDQRVFLANDVTRRRRSRLSPMPEGFEHLPEQDLVSLLDYLTQHSRFLPLPLREATTANSARAVLSGREHVTSKGVQSEESFVLPSWGETTVSGVPFHIIDPQGFQAKNLILLFSSKGALSREMPTSVTLGCRSAANVIHLLSGVSGWGYPLTAEGTTSMILRLHYGDGEVEDHKFVNGVHFADYSHRVDVPGSGPGLQQGQKQVRYLSVRPQRSVAIEKLEFLKGNDDTAPMVLAVTLERVA